MEYMGVRRKSAREERREYRGLRRKGESEKE